MHKTGNTHDWTSHICQIIFPATQEPVEGGRDDWVRFTGGLFPNIDAADAVADGQVTEKLVVGERARLCGAECVEEVLTR